jgi:hypothetical protein
MRIFMTSPSKAHAANLLSKDYCKVSNHGEQNAGRGRSLILIQVKGGRLEA